MPTPRWIERAEILVLVAGIGLRLVRFLDQRPLWLDEALLALNVLTRSPIGLLRPLDNLQMSPVGFLWAEWLVTRLAGSSEQALRFLPLVAAVLGLVAFARLARRILEPGTALAATAFAALSPLLIYYSAEVKAYGVDFLVATLLMHATLTLAGEPTRAAWIRWALVAAGGALFSTAAPFFVAGSALALLVSAPIRSNPRALPGIIAAGTPAAVIFVAHVFTVYHSTRTVSFMQLYWTESFLDGNPRAAAAEAIDVARDFWAEVLFDDDTIETLPRKTMTVLLASSLAGAVALGIRAPVTAVLLLAPALLAGFASLAKQWPLTPRLLLFAAPAVMITLAAGFGLLARAFPRAARAPVQALMSLAVLAVALLNVPRALRPDSRFVDVPGALRDVGDRAGPNATVYVSADLGAACQYYLAWHPHRDRMRVEAGSKECRLRDTRTVIGVWPEFIGIAPGMATSAPRTIRPDWLEAEEQRMRGDAPTEELWVLIGHPELRVALPPWLEQSGLRRAWEKLTPTYAAISYRQPLTARP